MSYIYGAPILDVSRSHTTTHHSRQDSSGRVISSSQSPLPDNTQHSQQTNIHARGGIRTHDLSRRAAADLRLLDRAATGTGNATTYGPHLFKVINPFMLSCFNGTAPDLHVRGIFSEFRSTQSLWVLQGSQLSRKMPRYQASFQKQVNTGFSFIVSNPPGRIIIQLSGRNLRVAISANTLSPVHMLVRQQTDRRKKKRLSNVINT